MLNSNAMKLMGVNIRGLADSCSPSGLPGRRSALASSFRSSYLYSYFYFFFYSY
jgi:hypothetical protein